MAITKIYNAEFMLGCTKQEQFPNSKLPEIAFAGRSNVGKSSLINSFVHRKNLARTSSTPGKTQEINFFSVDNKWILVDMPGFGYTSKGKQKKEQWAKLNFDYLQNRENLKLVCVLIDSRHDPQKHDLSLIEWLENNQKKYLIILTKCDKIKPTQINERLEQITHLVSQCNFNHEVISYSSVKEIGRKELMAIVKKSCEK